MVDFINIIIEEELVVVTVIQIERNMRRYMHHH